MPREWLDRVVDILDAIARIRGYTQGMDVEAFVADRRTQAAVAYDLLVIGESAANLPGPLVEAHPEVAWARIRGMRNVLAHAYFDIDPAILWRTISASLPDLETAMRRIAGEAPTEG